jgi:uncharacterized membrane-anchored protein
MIMVLVPVAPPGLALAVVAAVAAVAVAAVAVVPIVVVVVVVIVVAPGRRRRLSGRLRDDRRWSRGCDSPLRR